jgi:hypothetical protein
MDNPLYKAFTGDDEEMMGYFEATTSDQMRFDFKALLSKAGGIVLPDGLNPEPPQLNRLEAFTMAAMQGLCANPEAVKYFETVGVIQCTSDLPKAAVNIAKATLSELSKNQ